MTACFTPSCHSEPERSIWRRIRSRGSGADASASACGAWPQHDTFRVSGKASRGVSLLEAVIALALAGLMAPAIFGMISFALEYSDRARDHTTIARVATAQMESIKQQSYQSMPASYTQISPVPEGYTIEVTVTTPSTPSYTYPNATAVSNAVQKVEVKVTGKYTDRTLTSYKVKLY